MPTLVAGSRASRAALIAELRGRLEGETFPRLLICLMLLIAGGVAFLTSVVSLASGVESMALRYPLATVAGYLAFLVLMRTWIAVRRGWVGDGVLDAIPDIPLDPAGASSAPPPRPLPASWDDVPVERADAGFESSGVFDGSGGGLAEAVGGSLDLDHLWWLVIAMALACAGAIAIVFVVYSAPLLLAEVALDAALVSTVYRRLRREDASHWAITTVRRTWMSAVTLSAFMAALGFVLQQLAPEARSIGGVLRHYLAI